MKGVGFCVIWFLLAFQFQPALAVENLLGRRGTDFVLPDLNGKRIQLSQFQGKVVVLFFLGFLVRHMEGNC